MNAAATFSLNSESTVLTPEATGVSELLSGLREGHSISASQKSACPICAEASKAQWLFCETSGTSGNPKKIRRRPETWIKSFEYSAKEFSISAEDTYAVFGSLGHSLSLFATLEALHLGADLSVLSNLNPKRQIDALQRDTTSVLYVTPTQLGLLLRAAHNMGRATIPSARHVFIGGGTLSPKIKLGVEVLFPQAQIREFFGASETSFITMSDAATPAGSVGRAYAGVLLRIGAEPSHNQSNVGEIWVKSDFVFDGYAGSEDHGAVWNDGYLSIGEMGYLDSDGYLFLRGRKSRMVTVSDVNVFPEEIEHVVGLLSQVQCCGVITVPDENRGHAVICIIQSTGSDLDPSVIRKHCRKTLGPQAVPKTVHFLSEMPLLDAGKPDLGALKSHYENML